MSVATSTSILPFLKSSITSSRLRLLQIGVHRPPTFSCIRLKAKASSLTFSFEEEKMIVFDSSRFGEQVRFINTQSSAFS